MWTRFRRSGKSAINGQRSTSPFWNASSELVPVSTHFSRSAGTFRRFVYGLNGETGKAAVRTNLDWRVGLEADAQRTLRDWRQPGREVPKRQTSHNRSGNKGRRPSP